MISKDFLKSSIIYTIGGAMPMLTSILLLPFYLNMLDSDNFVILSFYISISLFLQIFFAYSLDTYFGIKYAHLTGNVPEQKLFLGTTSILMLIIGIILLIVTFIIGPFLFPLIFKDKANVEFGIFAFASIITAFFNSYFKAASNCLIYLKKPGQFLAFNVINLFATLLISIGGLMIYPNSLIGPISGRFFSGIIIFFLAFYIFRSNSVFKFEKKYLSDIYKFCTPYLFFVLSIWTVSNIDRYFLVSHIDSVHLAGYDQIIKCFIGIEFFQNSLSAVIYPKVFEIWGKHKKNETTPETNRYFNVFTAINIMAMIAFCILIPIFIKIFIPKEQYYFSFDFVGLIAAGYATRTILNYYLASILFSKSTSTLLKVFGISSIIQIIITYYCVIYFGLIGALYAGVITKIMQVLFSVFFTKNIFTYRLNYSKIYGAPILFIFVNVTYFIIHPQFNMWMYLAQFVFFGILFYFMFKNEIKVVLSQFLGKRRGNG